MDYKGYKVEKITEKDMPNELFEDIAYICGIDVAVSLLKNFSGNNITVPTNGFEKIEKKIVLKEYSQNPSPITIKRLARNLERQERTIRNILESYDITPAVDGQLNLFRKEL